MKNTLNRLNASLTIVALACSIASTVEATTLRRMDLPAMVQAADRIVHARAAESRTYWDAEHRRIFTDTTFEVLETVKGAGPASLTVTMLGGRIDPVELSVEGTPVFRVGEEVVLMTSPRPDGKKNLVGFSQGVFRIEDDRRTGERFVTGGLRLAALLDDLRSLHSHGAATPGLRNPQLRLVPAGGPEVKP